jgi:hypothetical protein
MILDIVDKEGLDSESSSTDFDSHCRLEAAGHECGGIGIAMEVGTRRPIGVEMKSGWRGAGLPLQWNASAE